MKHKPKHDEHEEKQAPDQQEATETNAEVSGTEETVADKADKLEQEVAELNDKYLRLYSEYDNYRKRSMRERAELVKIASSDVISSLLPVVDDFERALKAFPEGDPAYSALRDGVSLIYSKLLSTLTQQGLEPIQSLGTPFDTDFHEAVTNIPSPSPEAKGTVLDEIQKGYILNGKVIRFAKVVVAG